MGAIDWLMKRTRRFEEPIDKRSSSGSDGCPLEEERICSHEEDSNFYCNVAEMAKCTEQISGRGEGAHIHVCERRVKSSSSGKRPEAGHPVLAGLAGAASASSAPVTSPQVAKSPRRNFFITKSQAFQQRWNSMRKTKYRTTGKEVQDEEEADHPRTSFVVGRQNVINTSGKLESKKKYLAATSVELEADNKRRNGQVRAGKLPANTDARPQAQDIFPISQGSAPSIPGCAQRENLPSDMLGQGLPISNTLHSMRLQKAFSEEYLPLEESTLTITREEIRQRFWHDFDLESYHESFPTAVADLDTKSIDTISYVETVDLRAAWEEWFSENVEQTIAERISILKSKAMGAVSKFSERYVFRRQKKSANPLRTSCSAPVNGLDKVLDRQRSLPKTSVDLVSTTMSAGVRSSPMLHAPPKTGQAGPSNWTDSLPVKCSRDSIGLCDHMIRPLTADEKAEWQLEIDCAAVGQVATELMKRWKWAQVELEKKVRRDAYARREQVLRTGSEAEENQRVLAKAGHVVEKARGSEDHTTGLRIDDCEVGPWNDISTRGVEDACLPEIKKTETGDGLEDEYVIDGDNDDEYDEMRDLGRQFTRRWGMSHGPGDMEEGEEGQDKTSIRIQRLDSALDVDSTKDV